MRGLGSTAAADAQAILEAQQHLDIALVAHVHAAMHDGIDPGYVSTAAWLADTTRISRARARQICLAAERLSTGRLDVLREAFTAGRIDLDKVHVVIKATEGLDGEDRQVVEQALVDLGATADVADVRKAAAYVKAIVATRDEDQSRWETEQAVRGFDVARVAEGLGDASGLFDPELCALIDAVLDKLAKPLGVDDTRTATQRRHDALKEALHLVLDSGSIGEQAGQRPHLRVTVDLSAGLPLIGRLDGGGFIDHAQVEELCCDPETTLTLVSHDDTWSVDPSQPPWWHEPDDDVAPPGLSVVPAATLGSDPLELLPTVDEDQPLVEDVQHGLCCSQDVVAGDPAPDLGTVGLISDEPLRRIRPDLMAQILAVLPPALGGLATEVLDQGHATRFVTPAQMRALAVRDGGCIGGCGTDPSRCTGHHVIHWIRGGPTDLWNLVLVCRRHHTLIHRGLLRVVHREGRFVLEHVGRRARAA